MRLLANTTSPFVRIARVALTEKGHDPEVVLVDPWADDPPLRAANAANAANAATRVPTLVLDDSTPLAEAMLIEHWLEATRPAPGWAGLAGTAERAAGVLSRGHRDGRDRGRGLDHHAQGQRTGALRRDADGPAPPP